MATKSSIFSSVISGSPMITSEKLVGSENYLSWFASVKLLFMGQGYEDHLVTQEADIPKIDKFFMVLTLIGLRPDLETVHDQILGSSSVSSLDDVFACLLHISSTQTLSSNNTSDSSVLVSQTNSRGGRNSNRGRGQRLHCTYCNKLGHTRDREYDNYLRYQTTKSASVASVAQTGNASACLTHTSSLGPWILDSSASDHILDRSTGKTIGIGHESQGLYHLTSPSTPAVCISTDAPLLIHSCLGHPSVTDLVAKTLATQKLKKLGRQLLKEWKFYYLKKAFISAWMLTCLDKLSAKATKCIFLGYSRFQKSYRCYSSETHRYFLSADVTFFEDSLFFSTSKSLLVSKVLPLLIISPPDVVPSCPLQAYHRRHRVVVPPSLAEVPADSLPIPSASPAPALPLSADLPITLRKGWQQAMADEMAALHSNGTWDLIVLPSSKSIVGCRWVYIVKVGPDGQIAFVRLLLSMAVMRSWPLYQLVIKNVFLHGDLAKEVYMEQPPGFIAQGESSLVCSIANHFVFYHHNSSGQCIYLIVYVDDIVITGSDQNGIQKLKQHLFTHFQTKDLEKLKYFLGIEIAQSNSGVILSQGKYALNILEEIGMLDCKPVGTPMDPNVKLIPGQGEPLRDPRRYRRLVDKLNYLTITRPDIFFPVSVVSQFLQSLCDSHWDAVIRILRYIKGVLHENRGHTQVVGYADVDWIGSPTDRRSTSGYCVFIGGNLIS
ncbi:Retrovirus-related Pol polyprotein from transposon RE2 [Vitis vinifera]|uniref:Retrovirus-related Pol polyprotein from transposon RE2 n=1 Tax=Vitis vinifera TaxID=29760 RepID=A0A438EGI2_VITVI|nr:Retrovirus-related Pol polyprotein from transposon RE2 [Vitis vinifera]